MDKSLDEIIASNTASESRKPSESGSGNGVRKSRGRSRKSSRRSSGRGSQPAQHPKVALIRNLSEEISEDDLRDLFRKAGPVVRVEIGRHPDGARSGLAWVVFDFSQDALVAAERFNQRRAAGKVITVRRVSRVGETGADSGRRVSLNERIGTRSRPSSRRDRSGKSDASVASKAQKNRTSEDLDAELDAYMQVESSIPDNSNQPEEKNDETFIDV